jgi:myo-inositol catabolism protein IolS
MNTSKAGGSGINISKLGLGCWAFGGGNYWGEQNQSDVNNTVTLALESGMNFFDTAEVYNDGNSEESLGKALKNRREKAIIGTKVSTSNCKAGILEQHLDASLLRLNTDYVDFYMLHWPINELSVRHFTTDDSTIQSPPTTEETFFVLDKLKKAGKIRSIGVSNFGVKQLQEVLNLGVRIDVNEIAYNIFSRAIEHEIAPFCMENNISIIASMALQQGLLTGIYQSAEDVPYNQAHSRHFKQERGMGTSRHFESGAEDEIFTALPLLKQLALEQCITLAQLSIAWIAAKKFIGSALVGARDCAQLSENITAILLNIAPEVIVKIDEISLPVLNKLGFSADYYENSKVNRIC